MTAWAERMALALALSLAGVLPAGAQVPGSLGAEAPSLVIVQVPEVVYTSVQGQVIDSHSTPGSALSGHDYLRRDYQSWLFHLVLRAPGAAVRIEGVTLDFLRGGSVFWSKHYSRSYLENLSWLEGAMEYSTEYFLENIEFVDNTMQSLERPTTPDVPAGGAVTWARIQEEQPFFASADALRFDFEIEGARGRKEVVRHTVALRERTQTVAMELPFSGVWLTKSGNDLATGHRRTGLNGLTTYAWDFMQVGDDHTLFRSDGKQPEDYYAYDAPVLATAGGVVVHVRNDIPDYGIGITPPRERLEADGDVFAGNLVVIDHGNGEYTLTSHMRPGTIPVSVGDRVSAGDFIGRVGNSGASMVPHIHINLMDGPHWLKARGVPSMFKAFTRVSASGPDEFVEQGNPMTGWLVRPGR